MAETPPPKGGKGKFSFDKHKGWYIGGGIAFMVVLFFVYRSNQASNAASSASNVATDPQTGYPVGSAADNAALAALGGGGYYPVGTSGTTGATGPAGPAGPAGPPGPTGRVNQPLGITPVDFAHEPTQTGSMAGGGGSPGPGAAGNNHVVAPGQSLTSISQKHYGTPAMAGAIAQANQHTIGANGAVFPGQRLVIP
jgi:hypothetical protein